MMGARKFPDFDADEFKRDVADSYCKVTERLQEERLKLNLKGTDMARMLSITASTYYEAEHGCYSVTNDSLKIMYDNGFDIDYIFTGRRMISNIPKEALASFDDKEIENLLRSMCVFIKDFEGSYKSLKKLCDEKDDVFYCIINKDGKKNVYEIFKEYHKYNQEEMAVRTGYSLNMYKRVKKSFGPVRPDSMRIFTIYKGLNIPPLMCIDERASNINEMTKLAAALEREALSELRKMNPTLYSIVNELNSLLL
jgi:transcriptional regulator with XRE-family HTH domain